MRRQQTDGIMKRETSAPRLDSSSSQGKTEKSQELGTRSVLSLSIMPCFGGQTDLHIQSRGRRAGESHPVLLMCVPVSGIERMFLFPGNEGLPRNKRPLTLDDDGWRSRSRHFLLFKTLAVALFRFVVVSCCRRRRQRILPPFPMAWP